MIRSPSLTHLIINNSALPKYKDAKKVGSFLVTSKWVDDSYAKGQRLPETNYKLHEAGEEEHELVLEKSKPTKQKRDNDDNAPAKKASEWNWNNPLIQIKECLFK